MKKLRKQTCNSCGRSYFSGKKELCRLNCSQYTATNYMDPGNVPLELTGLTYLEQQLIARIHPVVSVYRIRGHQLGYSGHVINFPQDVKQFAAQLPHRIADLTSVLAVRVKNNKDDTVTFVNFHVRAKKVKDALLWLQQNNPYYSDVSISEENLSLLPEDGNMSTSIQAVFQDDKETGNDTDNENIIDQVEVTGVPTLQQPHQKDQVLAILDWPVIGQQPVDEFNTPGYIVQAFPALFPHGKADLVSPREQNISANEYFKYLLEYKDQRFANDPCFSFFALNSVMRWAALRTGKLFVRHHEELQGKSIKELKELLHNSPSLTKKIMCYGVKLRGTKSYWRARLSELIDMEAQLGLPTVFVTFSAADLPFLI